MEVKLVVNGIEVELGGYDEVHDVCFSLVDHKKNRPVFDELAKSPSSQIRETIAGHDSISDETVVRLLGDPSVNVIRMMVDNDRSERLMTDDIFDQLVANRDSEVLSSLASHVGDYSRCDIEKACGKLRSEGHAAMVGGFVYSCVIL